MRIFITRPLSNEEKKEVKLRSKKIYSISPNDLTGINSIELPDIPSQSKKQINEDCLTALEDFSSLLARRNFDLKLYQYQKFRLYFELRNLMYEFERLKSLHPIQGDLLFTNFGQLSVLFPEIEVKTSKDSFQYRTILKFVWIVSIRLIKSVFSSFIQKDILFLDCREYYQNALIIDGTERKYQNTHMEYLYNKFETNESAYIDRFTYPNIKKRNQFRATNLYFKNFNSRSRIYEERILAVLWLWKRPKIKALKSELYQLFKQLDIKSTGGIHSSILLQLFQKLRASTLFFATKELAYSEFFKGKEVRKLVITDEYSSNNRVIMNAAKAQNVEVIGFQHGSIHRLHPGYFFSQAEQKQGDSFPDYFVVWGQKWKEILVDLGWPEYKIKVLGHLRTDTVTSLIKLDLRPSMVSDKLDDTKKIIVFASQPQRDAELRKNAAQDVFSMANILDNQIQVVVKLHPRESDYEVYHEWAADVNCTNYILLHDINLYRLLSITDILITSFSTVGTEALYFSIPLIIIDPLDQDVLNFCKDEVAFQVKNSEELIDKVGGILKGELNFNQEKLQEYIKSNAYKIDGETSQRYKEFIMKG